MTKRHLLILFLMILIFNGSVFGEVEYYTVDVGETLWMIANKFGVSVEELAEWNGISNPSQLQAGQQLKVYTSIKAAEEVTDPYIIYEVKAGDTLWSISRYFNLEVDEIVSINNIYDSNDIYIGLPLLIPTDKFPQDKRKYEVINFLDIIYLVYQVKGTESLADIADKFDVSANLIYQANGQLVNEMADGTEIFIPLTNDNILFKKYEAFNISYLVQGNETIEIIADRYLLPVVLLQRINGLGDTDTLRAGRRLLMPLNKAIAAPHTLHTTKAGEQALAIATKYGRDVRTILDANYLSGADAILPAGLILIIPPGP